MWGGFESRKFPRVKSDCTLTIQNPSEDTKLDLVTENIGTGGICVILNQALPKFSKLRLTLDLTDGSNPISCDARVVWSVSSRDSMTDKTIHDTGIEFTDLAPRDRDRIERLVKSLSN